MKYCAALLFGLCLFAGPVAAQTDTDKSKGTEVNAATGQTGDAQPVKKKPLPSSRQAVAKGGSDSGGGAREPKKLAAKKKAPAETKTVVPGSGEITSGQGGDEALAKKSTAKTEAGGDANASSDKTEAGQTPKKKSVKKAPADTKKEATGAADTSGDRSGGEPSTEKKSSSSEAVGQANQSSKKSAAAKKNSGATAIVKEGGQHCSGLDEYRVCW